MSYCRFSSDDWRCDVYAYESCNGHWVTHVAGNKSWWVPRCPPWPHAHPSLWDAKKGDFIKRGWRWRWFSFLTWRWWVHHRIQGWVMGWMPRRAIGLPEDGKTFEDGDLDSFLRRLLWLRQLGYNVPQGAIDSVMDELEQLAEETAAAELEPSFGLITDEGSSA